MHESQKLEKNREIHLIADTNTFPIPYCKLKFERPERSYWRKVVAHVYSEDRGVANIIKSDYVHA